MTKKRQILFSVIRGLLAILIALLVATLLIFLSADPLAALDVFEEEPVPAGDPVWTAQNLLLTPHISGQMSLGYTRDRNVALFCEDLERYGRGEKPTRLVDRRIGY